MASTSFIVVPHRNRPSTIFWHKADMPDDDHLPMPRKEPKRVDLGRIQTDLEFLIERVSKLPTRKEQALKPLYVTIVVPGLSSCG